MYFARSVKFFPVCYENVPDPNLPPTYTKEEFEKAVAAEKAKFEKTANDALAKYKDLQKNVSLTQKERDDLAEKIKNLEAETMTKEELARREAEAKSNEILTKLKVAEDEKVQWKTRFESSTIEREIVASASTAEAFDPQLFVLKLMGKAKLIEGTDAAGRPNGKTEVKISHTTTVDGVAKELHLSPQDAIKMIKEDPKNAFLFRNPAKPGLGANNSSPDSPLDFKNMTMEQYMALRKKS
jgi:hypothetical protein